MTEAVSFSNRADVIAVLDALGIGRAALVGNSRGGVIAFDTAAEFPDRFVAVVGVAAGLGGYEATATAGGDGHLRGDGCARVRGTAGRAGHRRRDGPLLGRRPRPVTRDARPLGHPEAVREQQTDILRPDRVNGEPIPLDPPAEAAPGEPHDADPRGRRACSTAPRSSTPRGTRGDAAPNARAVIWDDVAHMIGMEQPERLANLIDEFLAPLPRWS